MKKSFLNFLSVACGLAISTAGLASCGGSSGDALTFTYLISKDEDTIYYDSYQQNPVMQYLMSKTWNGNKINFEFSALAAGSEKEQFANLIATNSLYDVMDLVYSSVSAAQLYEEEVLLDLTELVDQYMPNYKKQIQTNRDLADVAYSNINGEKKIIQIYGTYDKAQVNFEGYLYRRDWLVKYGTHPQTGEAFTYSYEDPSDRSTWKDDVMFPSWYSEGKDKLLAIDPTWDGTDPMTISDWEWMFGAFSKAIKDQNISDGYCYAPFYMGVQETGDFFTGFGGGAPLWSRNGGVCEFNAQGESMKSYLTCLNTWYNEGFLDKQFNEHSADMFYAIDTPKVHSGKVGLWQGRQPEIGDGMEDAVNYPLTKDILVRGCSQPINDKYGDPSTQYKMPYAMYQYKRVNNPIGISASAKDKDLGTLLTFIDYLYTEKGAIQSRNGLIREEMEEEGVPASVKEFYDKWDLPNGPYRREYRDGVPYLFRDPKAGADIFLHNASILNRLTIGDCLIKNLDLNLPHFTDLAVKQWDKYVCTGFLDSSIRSLMTQQESSDYSKVNNQINTYIGQAIPDFIKGVKTIEKDFATYSKTLDKYNVAKVTAAYQRILTEISSN